VTTRFGRLRPSALGAVLACGVAAPAIADDSLTGVHWWGFGSSDHNADTAPDAMLDHGASYRATAVEIVNTHGVPWAAPWYFRPMMENLAARQVNVITRVNYDWGQTVPAPSNPHYAGWANDVAGAVNTLKNGSRVFQLGNEANLNGEGDGWPNGEITPAGYASVYTDVVSRVRSTATPGALGAPKILVAPPSPGGVIEGVRWKGGAQWLGETIDAITDKGLIDGVALHAYGGTPQDFRHDLLEQVAVLDARGLRDVPIYVTEFNRFANPGDAAEEAAAADFVRGAYKVIDDYNRVPGNHNVVSMSWFVYDNDSYGGGGAWDGYSIEYWKNHGNPAGHAGDLFTAVQQTADRRYKAGVAGSRAMPAGVQVLDDFEAGNGRFNSPLTLSPATTGVSSATAGVGAEDSYTRVFGQRLNVVDDPGNSTPWRVRHLSGGANPNGNVPLPLSDATADGFVGFMLKTTTPGITAQIVFDGSADNASAGLDVGAPLALIADGEWHLYEWSLDATNYQPFPGVSGSDGVLPASGHVWLDSILLNGVNADATIFFDSVMYNPLGSLQSMLPVPEPATSLLLMLPAVGLVRRVRQSRPC
jgi:hypothetical protein